MDGRKVITETMRNTFNNNCNGSFDEFASFVAAHFALTQRNDTPYWQHICDKHYPDSHAMFRFQRSWGAPSNTYDSVFNWLDLSSEGMLYVQAGQGWNPFSDVVYNEMSYYPGEIAEVQDHAWKGIDKLQCPYDYYKDTLYAS